ncbi:hypothetical protein BH23CHL2_BH23CHL2_25780 [soil metagenome]
MQEFPFQTQPFVEPGLLDRLRGRPSKKNALVELNNLLVNGVEAVSRIDIERIQQKYGVDFGISFPGERLDMYASYVEFSYRSRQPDERPPELPHLRALLRIPKPTAEFMEKAAAEKYYRQEVRARIANQRLDQHERQELDEIQRALDLSDGAAQAIQHDEADAVVRAYLNQSVEDAMISPDEAAEFENAVASLGLAFEFTPEERARWDRFRKYWELQLGPLQPAPVSINLQKNETCYFATPATWHERRHQTKTIRYSGPHARIRIAKGLYWRAGSADIQRVTQEVLHTVDDAGTLYFTDKRVIYVGRNRNTNLRLNRILDFEVYSDGIELMKDAGRNPLFLFDADIDIAALTLNRLLTNDPPLDQPAPSQTFVEIEPAGQQLPEARESGDAGYLDGRHYTEYAGEIKQLKRDRKHDEALDLLNRIIDVIELESETTGRPAPPWYYEQAAIIHRKEQDYPAEIAVLQRYEAMRKRNGSPPDALTERLVSAQSLALSG